MSRLVGCGGRGLQVHLAIGCSLTLAGDSLMLTLFLPFFLPFFPFFLTTTDQGVSSESVEDDVVKGNAACVGGVGSVNVCFSRR